jgi:glutaredoxin
MPEVLTTASAGTPPLQGEWVETFFKWIQRFLVRPKCGSTLHVCMYTRNDCHLCEIAWRKLKLRQREFGFRLEKVDIDKDSELAARYGEMIPVILVDGRIRFRGALNDVLFARLFHAKSHAP